MAEKATQPTPALLAANRQLYQLRAKLLAAPGVTGSPWDHEGHQAPHRPLEGGRPATVRRLAEKIAALPGHLGWGSQALTAAIRARQRPQTQSAAATSASSWICPPQLSASCPRGEAPSQETTAHEDSWVKVYPDIALAMLRQELAAPGRLWLLFHHLDKPGRGLLRIDGVRGQLTSKSSPLRLCSWRQLRNLLQQGEGIFWARDHQGRIWLKGAKKVAEALGIRQLHGRPVAIPVTGLLQGIGEARAHLYASWHGSRLRPRSQPQKPEAMPIARATLKRLSGVGERSQQAYERRVGLKGRFNFALGERSDLERKQQRAWQQGRALFELKDYRGQQGKRGRTYLAWQLPNSYGCAYRHQQLPKGRQRKINRALTDLVKKGTRGNGQQGVDNYPSAVRRYYAHGRAAAKGYNRRPRQHAYWHARQRGRRSQLWYVLPGQESVTATRYSYVI